jgi:hypothetical protein
MMHVVRLLCVAVHNAAKLMCVSLRDVGGDAESRR